jgi:hypothetical protein
MGLAMRRAALAIPSALALAGCISVASLTNGPALATEDGGPGADGSLEGGSARAELYRDAVLADSPLGFWRFEESAGTTAKDETGGHPGTYKLSPTLGSPGLFPGTRAIELPDQSNAHVEVPGTSFTFGGLAPYSVEVWVKPAGFANYRWIAGTETTPPRIGWSVLSDATGEVLYEVWRPNDAGPAEVRSLSSNKALAIGRFQHVVVTYNGAVMKTYMDGALASSNPVSRDAPDTGTLVLGCRRNNDGTFLNGLDGWSLDEVAIYGAPLTDERIRAHYELGKP